MSLTDESMPQLLIWIRDSSSGKAEDVEIDPTKLRIRLE